MSSLSGNPRASKLQRLDSLRRRHQEVSRRLRLIHIAEIRDEFVQGAAEVSSLRAKLTEMNGIREAVQCDLEIAERQSATLVMIDATEKASSRLKDVENRMRLLEDSLAAATEAQGKHTGHRGRVRGRAPFDVRLVRLPQHPAARVVLHPQQLQVGDSTNGGQQQRQRWWWLSGPPPHRRIDSGPGPRQSSQLDTLFRREVCGDAGACPAGDPRRHRGALRLY